MEIEQLEIVQLELKYCERCGGLWLRLRGSGNAYCGSCAEQMESLPVRRKKKRPTLPGASRFALKSVCDKAQVWLVPSPKEGNA